MTTLEALDIVLDLAAQNVILDSELDLEAERQREAIRQIEGAVPEMMTALRRFLDSEREQSEGIRSQAAAMARAALAAQDPHWRTT